VDRLLLCATIVAVASILVRTFIEPDVWWEIAIGRDIIAHMAIPGPDRFAAAAFGRIYHDSHWLFQVLLASLDHDVGMKAVGAVPILIWGATLYFCYRAMRIGTTPAVSCLLIFLVAVSCNYRFMPRADIVSYLMIAVFYFLLQSRKYATPYELTAFFFLQTIWSNSHGLFVIGPFMAGCYILTGIINSHNSNRAELKALVKLLGVLLIATLCTPFPFDGWRFAFKIALEAGPSSHKYFKTINELYPVFGPKMAVHPEFWAFVAVLLMVVVSTALLLLKKRALPYHRLLIVCVFLLVGMSARKNISLFTLTAAPLIAENLRLITPRISLSSAIKWIGAISLICFSLLPISGLYYQWLKYEPFRFGIGVASVGVPTGLPEFLRKINYSGQIYNSDQYGGFLLYNGFVPLIDGRREAYDVDIEDTILHAPFDQRMWESMLAKYNITGLMLANGSDEAKALIPRLSREGTFQLVYADNICSFWLRNQ
jgi:hypothetical protein